jgi:hypothetical protein
MDTILLMAKPNEFVFAKEINVELQKVHDNFLAIQGETGYTPGAGSFTTLRSTGLNYITPVATTGSIKAHAHQNSSFYNVELRAEFIGASGTFYGLNNEAHLDADGTASVFGNFGVAKVTTGFTCTDGTIVGCYGQARADGTMAGSGFMAGLYGLIEASAAITASHVCSAWLDSHQANVVTGSHELLYMTNNGAAVMDQAFFIYAGNSITALMEINTASGMVSDTAETGGTAKKIKITLDGVVYYLNAYTG